MFKSIFSIVLLLLISLTSFAQSIKYKEYLIKLPDTFYKSYHSVNVHQKDQLIFDYFESSDLKKFKPLFKFKNNDLTLWSLIATAANFDTRLNDLKNRGKLLEFQTNHTLKVHAIPNDSLLYKQWYHQKIRTFESWDLFQPNEDILLAVIDTGIDYNHPDLKGRLWLNNLEDLNHDGKLDSTDINHRDDDGNGYIDDVIGWDFTDAPRFPDGGDYIEPDNDPMDDFQSGHGTPIAGIISAKSDNSIGIAGIVPELRVMNLRAGTASGYLEEDDVAEAIVYAVDNGARIINMSFGDVIVSAFLKDVISFAYSAGVIMVASSGNSGTNENHYPSGFAETISVGATDSLDNLSGFSSWGQTLDLVAPGANIFSCSIGDKYMYSNGTSFSAPMVSAATGFILANHPEFNNEQVRNILKSTTDDLGSNGWDPYFGSGRLNLLKAAQVEEESSLFINSPLSGSYTFSDSIPIVVTAQDVDLKEVSLFLGVGENPNEWQEIISNINHQIISDTIVVLDLSNFGETSLVFKLKLYTWQGELKEYHSLLHIDKTEPVLTVPQKTMMLDEDRYAILISFETDDITTGEIYFRPGNSNLPFNVKSLKYETNHHKIKIRSDEISGTVEFYIRIRNLAGLQNQGSGRDIYTFELSPDIIPTLPFPKLNRSFPKGYVLPKIADFDNDGNGEIIISLYDENNSFGNVAIYEFEMNQFVKKPNINLRAIPRDFGDSDGDGKSELLTGYGRNSLLLEATVTDGYPEQIVWQDTADFWASRITDLDNDGIFEILGKSGSEFKLLESTGNNLYNEKFVFPNSTSGNNSLGPPTTIVDDWDNDSYLDLMFGDYDGDILIFENTGNDNFVKRFEINLQLPDATDFLASGNFIDPMQKSVIAGAHTSNEINHEHEFDSRYWSYFHLISSGDNNYNINQRINIFGYSDIRDYDSGVSTGKDWTDNYDYLFITAYPDLYIFKTNGDSLVPKWYVSDVQSNKVIYYDFDKNGLPELYFNDGQSFVGYELGESNQPQPPTGFSAAPIDTSAVRLEWLAVDGSQKYIIYRGLAGEGISPYDSVISELYYKDTIVVKNQVYDYAIRSYDNSYINPYSNLSLIQSAKPNDPPKVDTLIVINQKQLQICFNEPILKSSFSGGNFYLIPQMKYATSAITKKNGYAVLVSFSEVFRTDTINTISLTNIKDIDKTVLDSAYQKLQFQSEKIEDVPYITEWSLEDRYHLKIVFNLPMDTLTIFNLNNYFLEPAGEVTNVESIDNENTSFILEISSNSYLGPTGITSYITFENIKSRDGILFEDGNRFSLSFTKSNLQDLIVYPQPAKTDLEEITFANITENTEIKIFDIHGHLVIELKENDQNGGLQWNMKNKNGKKVAGGIYIYYAKNGKETKTGKIAIIR